MRTLIAYRWDGRVPEGSRNTTLFVYGTFLVRVTGVRGFAEALRTFAARVCDLDDAEIDQIVGSIARKLEEDGRGYRYTIANAAAALAITPEEVKRAGMSWVRALGRQALACTAALTVASVSAWFAWRYAKAVGGPGFEEATLLGGAVVILDLFKCLMLPSLTKGAWLRGWRIAALVGALCFVGLLALNIWGIMSVELLERATLAAKHATAAQQLADLEAQRGRVESRLRVLGETRPVATVEADLAAERHNRRWTASRGCTAATRDSRTYCASYNRLFGELAAAQEAANLRARRDELDGQIATSRASQTPNAAELQLIAKLFGIDVEMAGFARALVFAIVVELVCAFAPTLVWVNLAGSRARRRRRGAGRSWLASGKRRSPAVWPAGG